MKKQLSFTFKELPRDKNNPNLSAPAVLRNFPQNLVFFCEQLRLHLQHTKGTLAYATVVRLSPTMGSVLGMEPA